MDDYYLSGSMLAAILASLGSILSFSFFSHPIHLAVVRSKSSVDRTALNTTLFSMLTEFLQRIDSILTFFPLNLGLKN